MPLRRTTKRTPKKGSAYPRRKYPLPKKNYQSKYELNQPTALTARNAFQTQVYATPLWPASKLIHNMLYYSWGNSLTSVAGTTASRLYTCNGLYDPDISGTGHQVMGFDQIMTAYEHYAVIRSKISVSFTNRSAYPVRVGIYLSSDVFQLSAPEDIMENGLCKSIILDATSTGGGNGERVRTLSLDCDMKKMLGYQRYGQLQQDNTRGSVAANPAEQSYFHVFAFSSHGGSTAMAVDLDLMISYDAIFFEPRKLNPS